MQGSFVMLQMDDLRQIVTEIVEEVCAKRGLNEKPSTDEGEWLTREEVCEMLHITYTTLWRKEKEGVIKNTRWVVVTSILKKRSWPCSPLQFLTPDKEIWVVQRYNRYIRKHMAMVAELLKME